MNRAAIVVAGGGCRTLWSAGVIESVRPHLDISEWAGVSAGAAMAVACAIDRMTTAKELFVEATAKNPRNFYPERVLRGGRLCPHEDMYANAMRGTLGDDGLTRLRSAAPVRVLKAHVAARGALRTSLSALVRYERSKLRDLHGPEHVPGITPEIAHLQSARTIDEVIDHVILSSATPPFTRPAYRGERLFVDGGLIDAVPVRILSEDAQRGPVIVLVSRRYPSGVIPQGGNRLYLEPSVDIPVSKWDYASPRAVEAAYELGRRDGARYLHEIDRFIARVSVRPYTAEDPQSAPPAPHRW